MCKRHATPFPGSRDFVIPPETKLITRLYGSAQELKTGGRTILLDLILLEGDSGFQVSLQELSTIIKNKLDVIVFPINHDWYTDSV
ncbi:hypothetical protein DPSP01_006320 [Paraphaeosphaeria sporulosa]